MTVASASNPVSTPRRMWNTLVRTAGNTEGWGKFTDLTVCSFALYIHQCGALPPSLRGIHKATATFNSWVNLPAFIRKANDLASSRNSENKTVWQRDIISIIFHVTLTAYYGLAFIRYLATNQMLNIGRALPVLNFVADVLSGSAGVTDFIGSVKQLRSAYPDKARAIKIREKWKKAPVHDLDAWKDYADAKITKWTARSGVKAAEKVACWNALKNCTLQDATAYSKKKVEKWSAVAENNAHLQKKGWCSVAFDISLIALVIFSLCGATLPLLVSCIFVSIFDMGCFMMDVHLRPKPIPVIEVPASGSPTS